jgi:hypothetical protein
VSFLRQARNMVLPPTIPALPGGQNYLQPYPRIMECLGSYSNMGNFVLALDDINQIKGRVR